LLDAIKTASASQPAIMGELARMLVIRKPADLLKSRAAIVSIASDDAAPATARRAALAALVMIDPPESLWLSATENSGTLIQLLNGIVLVPDPQKRAPFLDRLAPFLKVDATDDDLRQAAIHAAASMPGSASRVFGWLADLIVHELDVADAARALLTIPKEGWPAERLRPIADALLVHARKVPETERTANDFLDLTQLGTAIASRLPKESAQEIRKAFHSLGVNVLRLRSLHEQMLFDKTQLVVEAGKPVELIFENPDSMQHNWVLVVPGAIDEIGAAADKMTPALDSQGRTFVPNSGKVLQATKLLNPGESVRLRFTAPATPDKYPYICTFPAHWMRMRGTLVVVRDMEEYLAQAPPEPETPTITEWKMADLQPALVDVLPTRNLIRGKDLFASVGCVSCHKFATEGTSYGPELTSVFAKYKGSADAVLSEIVDPSRNIEPRFRSHNFKSNDGEDFTGFIVSEEGETLVVQVGPGESAVQKFPKRNIRSRQPQPQSLMPAGLLNTLNKEQILDLLAYLKFGSTAQPAQPKQNQHRDN
jgi:putative heme-binding domain-containing protein